jgi:choice-of-anchor C domain-containing protein
MKRIVCVSAIVLTVALGAVAAPTNLVVNGSFELSPDPVGTAGWVTIPSGATTLTGWTVTGPEAAAVDIVTQDLWNVYEGTKALDLNGTGPGCISQVIPTEVGQWYELSFAMSGNPGQVGAKDMMVAAGPLSDVPFSFTKLNASRDMMWETHTLLFQANSTTSEITFESITPVELGGKGPAVDDVRVSVVPVPGDIFLTGLGAVVLGWMRSRKFV